MSLVLLVISVASVVLVRLLNKRRMGS
jgi:hypothetical protein